MTAKEYLSQAYRLDRRIDSKLEQLRPAGHDHQGDLGHERVVVSDPRTCSPSRTPLPDRGHGAELDHDIDELVDLKDITRLIKLVNNPQYQLILEMRYLTYKSWREIADQLEVDERYIYKLHGLALKEFEKNLLAGQ